MNAHAMVELLRRHYLPEGRPPGGIFAPEIQAPGCTRRADLIWAGVTAANGRELVGHEIKVSRRDLLVELDDTTKSDGWQRYCDRWWLVLPSIDLAEGLELPPSWGVMTPPSGRRTRSMTVQVPAPELHPDEQGPAYRTLATWLHWRRHDQEDEIARSRRDVDRLTRRVRELEAEMSAGRSIRTPIGDAIKQVIEGLGGAHDGITETFIGDWSRPVRVDDVVAALKDLGEIERRKESALRDLGAAERGLKELRERLDYALERTA